MPPAAPILKVILETGELETGDNIRRAADLVLEAAESDTDLQHGAIFLKTSTGKGVTCSDAVVRAGAA